MKRRFSVICCVIYIILLFPVGATSEISGDEILYYFNAFDNGKTSCVNSENYLGSITYTTGDIVDSDYNGNKGIGLGENAWPSKVIKYSFKNAVSSDVISISFDFAKSNFINPQQAYLTVNTEMGVKNLFYMQDDAGIFGPNDDLEAWGDKDKSIPFLDDRQYFADIDFDFNCHKVVTYINGELLSEKSMPENFALYDIEFDLSMIIGHFDNLQIVKSSGQSFSLSASTDNFGNIVYDNDNTEVSVKLINNSKHTIYKAIDAVLYDSDERLVSSEKVYVNAVSGINEANVSLGIPKYGTYRLVLSAANSNTYKLNLARAVKSDLKNEKVNVCVNSPSRVYMDADGVFELINNAGFGGIRTDFVWRVSGGNTLPQENEKYLSAFLTNAKKYDLDVLALLPVNCSYYAADGDGGFNTSTPFLKAYKKYCSELAEKYSGFISNFEIGNELNGTKTIKGEFDTGENYYKVLNSAYQGIKEGNNDAKVITCGMQMIYSDDENHQVQFINELLKKMKDVPNYPFDYLGVHPYHYSVPEKNITWGGVSFNFVTQSLESKRLLNEYNAADKKMIATEFGWQTAGFSERDSAAYILRALALNDINDMYERVYIYDIMNTGVNKSSSEDNYGLINTYHNDDDNSNTAYSAKQSYLALCQWNKLIGDKKMVSHSTDDTVYSVSYSSSGGDVTVLWNSANSSVNVDLGTYEFDSALDMYGNEIDVTTNSKIDGAPIFLVKYSTSVSVSLNGKKVENLSYEDKNKEITFTSKCRDGSNAVFIVARYYDGRLEDIKLLNYVNDSKEISERYDGVSEYSVFIWQKSGMCPRMKSVHIGKTD